MTRTAPLPQDSEGGGGGGGGGGGAAALFTFPAGAATGGGGGGGGGRGDAGGRSLARRHGGELVGPAGPASNGPGSRLLRAREPAEHLPGPCCPKLPRSRRQHLAVPPPVGRRPAGTVALAPYPTWAPAGGPCWRPTVPRRAPAGSGWAAVAQAGPPALGATILRVYWGPDDGCQWHCLTAGVVTHLCKRGGTPGRAFRVRVRVSPTSCGHGTAAARGRRLTAARAFAGDLDVATLLDAPSYGIRWVLLARAHAGVLPGPSGIWNPDQWYEIRGFGTYLYVLVCTGMYWYTIVYMVHTSMYLYVPGLYSFFTSNIAMNGGNILVFNHDYKTVLYTEYLLPLSRFTKQYPQKAFGDQGTYQYVPGHTMYILVSTR